MSLQDLLVAHSDDQPSGENLEYDALFTALELAAAPKEEQQIGDQVLAGEEPDYKEVVAKATEVLEKSHDLRAAVYFANAQLNAKGLPGFAEATSYIRGCLEQFWDTCHPELDEDDGDATMRINAIVSLTDQNGVMRSLRRAPLTESRGFGRFSLRDIMIAEGEIDKPADMENPPDTNSVSAAFQDTDPEALTERLTAAKTALEDMEAIDAIFSEKTPGYGPDLGELLKILKRIEGRLGSAAGVPEEEAEAAEAGEEGGGGPAAAPAAAPGTINSRSDVTTALDRIIGYYEKNEPSSPLPVLLNRAKRLVDADFLTIMKDMAPDGVDNVNTIGGITDDE
ncbi:MAG: type VI secretion system protein TssA [Pseudomonadota bacterium]